jgi:hypothetical protein
MPEFHGIIIDKSLKNAKILDQLNVLSKKESEGWVLYKISVPEDKVQETVQLIQKSLSGGAWYAHLYDGTKVIAIFRNKVFEMVNNPVFFRPAVKYGISIGIPEAQLDFKPNKLEEEDF